MPLREYLAECRMFEAERARKYFAKLCPDGPPLNQKRIWTPRDSYGMKSL